MSAGPRRRRCLVADDHPALAAAVCVLLEDHGYEILGPVGDGAEATAVAEREQPDVAVVDLRMPGLPGVELLRRLGEVASGTAVVVYTADADEQVVRDAFEADVGGVVLKDAPLDDLARAVASVVNGQPYVDPALASAVMPGAPPSTRLTSREREVLTLLAEGLSHEAIGERLGIGPETVRTHSRKAIARLGARTRTQAVATAIRLGLLD